MLNSMTADEVREFFNALSNSRFDEIEARLHEDVVFEFPGRRFGGRHAGRRRVMVFLRSNQRLFQDGLRFTVHWAATADDRAIAQWTNRGTTRGGTEYANRGVTVFRLDGGQVTEIQDYLDTELIARTWPRVK